MIASLFLDGDVSALALGIVASVSSIVFVAATVGKRV